jgi:hypothetical protein
MQCFTAFQGHRTPSLCGIKGDLFRRFLRQKTRDDNGELKVIERVGIEVVKSSSGTA